MDFLAKNPHLVKYTLDIYEDDKIMAITDWINDNIQKEVQALDCEDIPWKEPETQAEKIELRAADLVASSKRIQMDCKTVESKLKAFEETGDTNSAEYFECKADLEHFKNRIYDQMKEAHELRG